MFVGVVVAAAGNIIRCVEQFQLLSRLQTLPRMGVRLQRRLSGVSGRQAAKRQPVRMPSNTRTSHQLSQSLGRSCDRLRLHRYARANFANLQLASCQGHVFYSHSSPRSSGLHAGILLTLAVAVVFWRHRDTPVIKASGRELSAVLWFAIMLSFCKTFLITAKPTVSTCAMARFSLGLTHTISFAAIAVKTNRSVQFSSVQFSSLSSQVFDV